MKKALLFFIFFLGVTSLSKSYSQVKINKMPCNAFVELVSEKKTYVERKDGSKIYGENLKITTIFKKKAAIDGTDIPFDEVKGYCLEGIYYIRDGKFFYKLMVSGKVSVYEYSQYVSNSRSGMNYNDCIYYAQKEGEDKFILMNNRESMVKLLGDCQKAINLINLDYKDLDKKVKENKAYLNEAFQIYNNGCSEVGIRQEKN